MKILLVALLISMSANIFAFGWGKYDYYNCPTDLAASECNSSCKKDSIQIEFIVNQQKNLIMLQFYDEGKISKNPIYGDCKIIDSRNWSCESKTTFTRTYQGMRSGQFEYRSYTFYPNRPIEERPGCAKR
jgi:hypothetical protein